MSLASRKGKLRVALEDDGTRFRRLEDLLTADVFGAYRYVAVKHGIRPLLARAISADGVTLEVWAEERGVPWNTLDVAWFELWPRLAGKEPDLIIALGDTEERPLLAILVEAKLYADQHIIEGQSQLGFYGAAMLENEFDEPPFDVDLPELRPLVFLTAGSDLPRGALKRARTELGDHMKERKTDVFWVSWRDAAILAAEVLASRAGEGAPAHELAVLEDLAADLEERGFVAPRILTSLPLPRDIEPLPLLTWALPPAARSRPTRRLTDLAGLRLDTIDADLSRWSIR